jgi:hypothetical protein
MFFEPGSYDPATVAEGRTRLAQFQGATSISSNQYFGRDEEETHSQGSDGGLLGDGSLSGLETFQQPLLCRFEDLPSGDETIPDNDQVRRFVWEHLNDVHRILHRLRCAGATVSASKLFIAIPKVVILGHRCNYEGRIPDDSKIAKIRDWPGCKSLSDVRAFLSLLTIPHQRESHGLW